MTASARRQRGRRESRPAVELAAALVIPSVGRASLQSLLAGLAHGTGPRPQRLIVVDDTPDDSLPGSPLDRAGLPPITVARSGGRGPAAARNIGWRRADSAWVSFLDDDVVPDEDWFARLADDLQNASPDTAGVQGLVRAPLPRDRQPTDAERNTAGLAASQWITADMTYRRSALAAVGGFDERFRRAYREDADLALRVIASGGRLTVGSRRVTHPARSDDGWVSVRQQAGNADDALMARLHGRRWRRRAGAPRGRRRRHLAITAAGGAAAAFAIAGRPALAGVAAVGWLAGTAEFAWARVAPGPRDADEVRRMLLTSAVIPATASWHAARGWWRHRRAGPWRGLPELVLFDRDGTLVRDVPYNDDPGRVAPMPGARATTDRLRRAGIRVGVVTNQSGVATGRTARDGMRAVNDRVEQLLGPFDVWQVCPHAPWEGCGCRKPAPGMVRRACLELGVDPSRCVVIGDTGGDVAAARAAGAAGILTPAEATRPEEIEAYAADRPACGDLASAADLILRGAW